MYGKHNYNSDLLIPREGVSGGSFVCAQAEIWSSIKNGTKNGFRQIQLMDPSLGFRGRLKPSP
jgi:hypothetical protein